MADSEMPRADNPGSSGADASPKAYDEGSPKKPSPSASGGGSWWGSWIDTAKTKSASVLEAVKKDLDELTTAVKTEATIAGSALADTLNFQEPESTANTVKKSLSSFFGQVSEVLNPSLTEEDDAEAILITKDGAVTLSGFHKHLAELQANDDIYLVEPDLELAEKYQRWMEVVDQDQFTQQRLDRQLASSQILQEKYEKLVPKQVPHMQFWQRYLFKRALLEDALANADQAERRAKQEANSNAPVSPRKAIIQTEQPKRAVAEGEVEDDDDEAKTKKSLAEALIPESVSNEAVASIDEEELSKLAAEELKWNPDADFTCNVDLSEEEQARLLAEYEQEIQERERKTSTAQKTPTKQAQPPAKGKGVAGKGQQQQQQSGKAKNQPQQQQQKGVAAKGKGGAQKAGASGKGDKKKTTTPAKDDSDESWEKEFDLDE